jgi:peptidoglycan/LPS O-acetylase OafA/YrhL
MLGIRTEKGQPIRWADAARLWLSVAGPVFLLTWLDFDAATGFDVTPLATFVATLVLGRLGDAVRPRYARTALFTSLAIGIATVALADVIAHADQHMWSRAMIQFGAGVLVMALFVAGTHLPLRGTTTMARSRPPSSTSPSTRQ